MKEIGSNKILQDILRQNIQNGETQRKKLAQQIEGLNDPQVKKYLQSIGQAMGRLEDVDKIVLSKIEGLSAPVEKKSITLLKKLFRRL